MTPPFPTQPVNNTKRFLFACYHFHLDPSNGAAIQLDPNPVYNGGGKRCFPESDAAGSLHNEILVMVDLAYAIPAGLTGTIHIDWFDPDNPRGSTIVPNHNGPGTRDNHGELAIDGEVFEVVGGQTVRKGAASSSMAFRVIRNVPIIPYSTPMRISISNSRSKKSRRKNRLWANSTRPPGGR